MTRQDHSLWVVLVSPWRVSLCISINGALIVMSRERWQASSPSHDRQPSIVIINCRNLNGISPSVNILPRLACRVTQRKPTLMHKSDCVVKESIASGKRRSLLLRGWCALKRSSTTHICFPTHRCEAADSSDLQPGAAVHAHTPVLQHTKELARESAMKFQSAVMI